MPGKLIGVGVGPGNPELLTLKAVRLIQAAPVLAYTVDVRGKSYARQTASAHIQAGQEELPLYFSMSPMRDERLKSRRAAAEQVLAVLAEGRDVIFLTEGDPLLYSTFQHLLSAMPEDIPVEVCPGISALFAAAAAAHFPLAIEMQQMVIAPAETAIGSIRKWLRQGHSLALFKAAHWLKEIVAEVNSSGLACEAVLVEHASSGGEVITRQVEEWAEREAPYLSIVLLRPLVASQEEA